MKKIAIILNTKKKKTLPLRKTISYFIKKKGFAVLDELEIGREQAVKKADLIITLGGDGTLLNAIKYIEKKNIPIIGVNVGGFGFITEVGADEIIDVLDKTLKGKSCAVTHNLLEVSHYREGKKVNGFKALNDAVIAKGAASRIMTLDMTIDDEFASSYFCDGLIVSSAVGSTAHSLSAGGPVIHPQVPCFVISPICPHTLNNRPLLVSEHSRISISPVGKETKEIALTIDGQESVFLKEKDVLEIKKSSSKIRLISSGKKKYFEILKSKLRWGGAH